MRLQTPYGGSFLPVLSFRIGLANLLCRQLNTSGMNNEYLFVPLVFYGPN